MIAEVELENINDGDESEEDGGDEMVDERDDVSIPQINSHRNLQDVQDSSNSSIQISVAELENHATNALIAQAAATADSSDVDSIIVADMVENQSSNCSEATPQINIKADGTPNW